MRYLLLAGLLMIGLSASPASATDQDTLNKLIAKSAPPVTLLVNTPGHFKPKLLCTCLADLTRTPGFVALDGIGRANCWNVTFNPDGSVNPGSLAFCPGNFIVIH